MSCKYYDVCKNRDKCCFKCYDEEYLKLANEKKRKTIASKDSASRQGDDSWKQLEEEVSIKLNDIPTIQEARRTRASGALWFEKGDVKDMLLHAECKERIGNDIKNGADKSISFQKLWLTKAKKEASEVHKTMCVPFRFKGDDNIYVCMDFDDLAMLVAYYKELSQEKAMLESEIKQLREILENKEK